MRYLFNSAAALFEPDSVELAKNASYHYDYQGGLQAVSLYGALHLVAHDEHTEAEMLHVLWDILGESPVRWNDAPERTKEEVVQLLRKCGEMPTRERQLENMLRIMLAHASVIQHSAVTYPAQECDICQAAKQLLP